MGKQSREKWENREIAADENAAAVESKWGLEKTCVFIIRCGVYASLFVPLIVLIQFFFPFVAPKTIIFRILVEIIFAAYLFLAVSNSKYRPRLDALTISLTAFLTIFIIASFTGINLSRSFWSTYERMTGIFTMLHLYAFFIILKSVFKKKEDWEKFLAASIIAGVAVSIYTFKTDTGISTRGGGTIGNSSFLASYLIFNVFFAITLFLINFLKRGGRHLFWQIFSGISLLIMLPVFISSTARGAIAGFFIGLAVLFFGYLVFSGKKILSKVTLILIIVSMLGGISMLLIMPSPIEKKIQETLLYMKSRFVVWGAGSKGFLERPILGWGPENFNVVFQKNFNPCMSLVECGGEVWFDRVHNIILDTLVATGVIGLAAYLSIYLMAVYGLFQFASKISEKREVFLPLGIVAVLAAYFTQDLLVFDMINSYLLFFLTMAFAGFLIDGKKNEELQESKTETGSLKLIFVLLTVISIIFIIWAGNLKPLMANRYIIKMVSSANAQDFAAYFQKSLDSWMDKYETREQMIQKLIRSKDQLRDLSPQDKDIFRQVYELGEAEMEKSVRENYLDFRHRMFLGELYLASYKIYNNKEKLEKAEIILKKAIELSPTNQQGYWFLAELKFNQGKPWDALPILEKAISLEPRVGRAHWLLSMAYYVKGDYELSLKKAFDARENGYDWAENLDDMNKVLDIYKSLDRWGGFVSVLRGHDEEQLKFVLDYIKYQPDVANPWFLLATTYANLNDYSKAIQAAEKAMALDPALKPEVEKFIESMKVLLSQ